MNLDLDEALKELKTRQRRTRIPQARWSENLEKIPAAVTLVIEAVRAKALVIGEEYMACEIIKRIKYQNPLSVPILQFDLAIWRAPVKLVERRKASGRVFYRVDVR